MAIDKLTYPAKENAVQQKINEIIDDYVDLSSDQNITGVKTFVGQKKIGFKQSSSSDKLGFTLYNNSGTEKGYLEYNPSNLVDSVPLMTLGNYTSTSAGLTHVGFRKYSSISGASGAYNLLAPLISDARTPFNLTTTYTNFYLPLGFSNGTTTVTTAKTGVVDLSSLGYALSSSLATVATSGSYADLTNTPTIPTVDQTYDGTSTNAQSGVAIETILTDGSYSPTFDYVYLGADNYGYIYNDTDAEYDENATTVTASGSALRIIDNIGVFYNSSQLLSTDNTFYDGSSFSLSGTTLNYNTSSTHNISLFSDSESHISAYGLNGHYEFAVYPEALSLTNYNTSGNILGNCSLTVDTNNKLNANGGVVATTSDIPTVNNATLTITQGGVSKGTFTANASSNVTIALDAGGGGGSSSLAGLSDVSLTSPSSNQVLSYDGSEWINNSLKTINLQTVVGSGNIVVQAPLTAGDGITIEGGISNWNTATQYSNISSIDENCNITYGGGIYLVTDRYGYTSTSTDGETWAVASQNSNLGQEEWWAVCYGNGKFVAICDAGYISTSTDGATWSSLVDVSVPHSNIAYGNNLYVALTANGYVSTSSDAETWTTQTYNSDLGNQDWSKPIFNGSQFVTVSPNGYVAFSDDGETWSVSETDLANTFTWYAFGYNGIYYVTVGINGYLSYSPDGVSWSEPAFITNLGQRGWVDVTYDGTRLITIGNFGYLADSETSQIISANVTIPVFTGATQSADGTSGLVKQPLAGDQLDVLTGDGDWSALKTINNTDLFAWPNDTNLSLADTTLSNVSSIDSNSAVQTALDSKVEYAFVIVDYTS